MDTARNEQLEREIFGSESDLSELEEQQQSYSHKQRITPPDEDSSGESGDEYAQEKRGVKSRKRATQKRDDARLSKKATKRKRKPQMTEQDLNDLPAEEASKRRLDMQIEAILKNKRAARPKKSKKDDEDVLDQRADEEVARLRETMLIAASEDEQANRDKIPATAKLRHLPQALEVLRKGSSISQSIIDNNLLEGVRRWLEPLPDHSLPALDIQKEFFPILKKMEFIDTGVLKESRLGRVVIFYTKCKRVSPDIARMANDLVSNWSRPIIKRSASYRDRVVPIASQGDAPPRRGENLNSILARARENEKNRVRKNAVAIPTRELGSYTVAPSQNAGLMKGSASVDVDMERRRKTAERLRSITRKVTAK